MIDGFLMSVAVSSGVIQFEERPSDFRMFANVLGMKVTLAAVSKQYLNELLAQTSDGTTAPVSKPEVQSAEVPPTASSHPPVRERPKLRLVTNE